MNDAPLEDVLATTDGWPAERVAVVVTGPDEAIATRGPVTDRFPLASVTKPLAAVGVLLAAQQGHLHLDEPAGPEGATVRHLLAHAAGLPMAEGGREQAVGSRRVYSNVGYEVLGEVVEARVGESFADWLDAELFAALGMTATSLDGSPARGATATAADLGAFARELLRADLLDDDPWDDLARVQFPGLDGVVPGYGRQTPAPWGLGVEIRGDKDPHWTGADQPAEVFGHFGRAGTFLWVDRVHGVGVVCLTDHHFGEWAVQAWAPFNDALAAAAGATGSAER